MTFAFKETSCPCDIQDGWGFRCIECRIVSLDPHRTILCAVPCHLYILVNVLKHSTSPFTSALETAGLLKFFRLDFGQLWCARRFTAPEVRIIPTPLSLGASSFLDLLFHFRINPRLESLVLLLLASFAKLVLLLNVLPEWNAGTGSFIRHCP